MPEGKSHVTPVGEAPTYVNTQRIPLQPGPAAGSSAESSPRKDLFDMSAFPFATVLFCFFFLSLLSFCLFVLFVYCLLFEICAITEFSASAVWINVAD